MTPAAAAAAADSAELEHIVQIFLAAFTSGPGCPGRIATLRELFLPRAVIVRTCGGEPAVHDIDEFLVPRERMLTDGTLTAFREWSLHGRLEMFGDIAQWFGAYAKEGVVSGERVAGRGMKSMQFVRTGCGWRISAVAWDDERDDRPGA